MYVISVKYVKDYWGRDLASPVWEYASYENVFHTGCLSTSLDNAIQFSTKEMAKQEFPKWLKEYKECFGATFEKEYDVNSLAIRKVTFKTEEKLDYFSNTDKGE